MAGHAYLHGRTAAGTEVFIGQDPYVSPPAVYVGGERVAVSNVRRYRDGGTTIIDTHAGRIISPSPLHPERVPTLRGEPLMPVETETDEFGTGAKHPQDRRCAAGLVALVVGWLAFWWQWAKRHA